MLTVEELGNIEKCLDDTGVSHGLFREGYRACLRDALECLKSKAFEELLWREYVQAAVKVWAEANVHKHFDNFKRAFEEKA